MVSFSWYCLSSRKHDFKWSYFCSFILSYHDWFYVILLKMCIDTFLGNWIKITKNGIGSVAMLWPAKLGLGKMSSPSPKFRQSREAGKLVLQEGYWAGGCSHHEYYYVWLFHIFKSFVWCELEYYIILNNTEKITCRATLEDITTVLDLFYYPCHLYCWGFFFLLFLCILTKCFQWWWNKYAHNIHKYLHT